MAQISCKRCHITSGYPTHLSSTASSCGVILYRHPSTDLRGLNSRLANPPASMLVPRNENFIYFVLCFFITFTHLKGALWHCGRASDSVLRGPGLDPHLRHHVRSFSKAHLLPRVLVNTQKALAPSQHD